MRRQHLIERAPAGNLLEAVEAVHGIQAQIAAHANFAVAQRVKGMTQAEIDRALWTDRSLIKTWAMRGTVHWLPVTEEPTFVSGMRVIREPMYAGWWAREGYSSQQIEQLYGAVLDALVDGPRTRQEVTAEVVPAVGKWAEPFLLSGWGGVFKGMCASGLIVFGPSRGTNITFARRDHWTDQTMVEDRDAALVELMRRYVRSFGPVTMQDTAYWIGAYQRDLKPYWEQLLPELTAVEVAGETRYVLAEDVDDLTAMEGAKLPVRLVPAFDPLLLAYRDKAQLLDMRFHKRIYGAAAWVYPAVLIDGWVAGAWKYERKAKQVIITIEPFRKITKTAQKAIQREANYLASISGRTAEVRYAE
jgi:hypothetical protein